MGTEYDFEIKNILRDLIESGRVEIKNPEYYFEIIEKLYPIFNNRINWEDVNEKTGRIVKNDEELTQFLNIISEDDFLLSTEDVVVIGDDLLNFAYKLKFVDFKKFAISFFAIPQHTYVIFEDSKKCLNHTFEGDIFFGSPLR